MGKLWLQQRRYSAIGQYYPHATAETYKGVPGFIYSVKQATRLEKLVEIPFTVISEKSVPIDCCEFVPDAYEALRKAAGQGKIILTKYEDNSAEKLNWIRKSVVREYEQSASYPEYRLFLEAKFNFIV